MTYAEKVEKLNALEDQDLLCRQAICNAFDFGNDSEVAELKNQLQVIRREYDRIARIED